jgi:hypothetical protein
MIRRRRWLADIRAALARSRVTALIGPRQSGKTTLARQIVPVDSPTYFDLEDPRSLARLAEPLTALAPLRGIVVIDEVQRRPDLFPILRVLADRRPLRARRAGREGASEALASGGISAGLFGTIGRHKLQLASPVHPDLS